jgi:GT2 family glycosyltransferase
MVRSSVLKETGGFSDNFPSAQDWDLWVRLRMRGPIRTVREPLVEYAVHRGPRISTNLAKKNAGFRRFYLRHKSLMSNQTRCDMMSLVAYMRSRSARGLRNRLFWLARSLRWGRGFVRKAGFVFSVLMHSF